MDDKNIREQMERNMNANDVPTWMRKQAVKATFHPIRWFIGIFITLSLVGLLLATITGVIGFGKRVVKEAADVAVEEFGPRAAVTKYEWFKDTYAALEAQKANIAAMDSQMAGIKKDMVDKNGKALPMSAWPRDMREDYSQARTEVVGLKHAFNSLAAQYNANHAKLNWKWADIGNMPAGASQPLPREVAEYVTQ